MHKRSPRIKYETEGGRTFTVTSIRAWNSTPLVIRQYGSKNFLRMH